MRNVFDILLIVIGMIYVTYTFIRTKNGRVRLFCSIGWLIAVALLFLKIITILSSAK